MKNLIATSCLALLLSAAGSTLPATAQTSTADITTTQKSGNKFSLQFYGTPGSGSKSDLLHQHSFVWNGKHRHTYASADGSRKELIKHRGTLTPANDLNGFASISPGGYLQYTWEENGQQKKLSLKSNKRGKLSHRYTVNGKKVAYAPEGAQWLQELMPHVAAKTGIGMRERVQQLYSTGGSAAVLADARALQTSVGYHRYITALLQQPGFDQAAVSELLQIASKAPGTDYERSQLLLKIPAVVLVEPATAALYMDLVNKISSDYERSRSLRHFFTAELPNSEVARALQSCRKIDSDYEKSKVYRAFIHSENFTVNHDPALFAGIKAISSDYEKSRVIRSMVGKYKLTPAQYQLLLPTVASISSDYEKSKVLRSIAPDVTETATALRADYKAVAQTISSDYEKQKVLAALPAER